MIYYFPTCNPLKAMSGGGRERRPTQMADESMAVPHVLMYPFPAQGHVNPMMKLAELLYLSGIHITFLNSDSNNDLLFGSHVHDKLGSRPGFRFLSISDGLPAEDPRSFANLLNWHRSFCEVGRSQLPDLLEFEKSPPVTCIIADMMMSFVVEVGAKAEIPVIIFRTSSACSFWCNFCIPRLLEGRELPFPDDAEMDGEIRCVPGMEGFLRRRDLPICFRARDINDPIMQFVLTVTLATTRASGFLLNTFQSLEGPILTHIRSHIPITYAVGPLHALRHTMADSSSPNPPSLANISLWEEDMTCMTWLDSKPRKSVLYVSYGSLTVMSRDQLLEFWHGLVNSGQLFLWVLRSDLVEEKEVEIPAEVEVGTRARGCLVRWAPQEQVLKHPAVGGFLTHSGWNSTLESLLEGVPMICWPYAGDQHINGRYVSEVWKVGLDMKDTCNRGVVEMMVKALMEGDTAAEFEKSAKEIAEMAWTSVRKGGSSYQDFKRLIHDIKLMRLRVPMCQQEMSSLDGGSKVM